MCLSYPATINAVSTMGINHDKLVLDWTKQVSNSAHKSTPTSDQPCAEGASFSLEKSISYKQLPERKYEDNTSLHKTSSKFINKQPDEKDEGSSSRDKSTSGKKQQPDEKDEGSSLCDTENTSGKNDNKQQPDEKDDKSTSGKNVTKQLPNEKHEGTSSCDKSSKKQQPKEKDEGSYLRDKSTNSKNVNKQQSDEKDECSTLLDKGTSGKHTNKQADETDEGSSSRSHDKSVSSDEGCMCTSHDQTTNEKCDNDHDSDVELIPGAAAGEECGLPTDRTLIIIGDNWDKNIKPRDMRSNNQVKSLHLFHSIATTSRVETLHLDDEQSIGSIRSLPISEFLPSIDDCTAIRDNYVVLVARVITENFKHFSSLRDCVPKHIHHEYSDQMALKTTMVSEYRIFNNYYYFNNYHVYRSL